MTTILISGANRGIGLEFVRQYAPTGAKILACCRKPEEADALRAVEGDITLHTLDVTDAAQINDLATSLKDEAIDILICNAGIYGPKLGLGELDYSAWLDVLNVNTLSPIRLAEAFMPHLEKGERKIIANITSKMGSIADNTSGGSYIYRSSKAALNAATKSLAEDLRPRDFTCIVMHPGWVRTDMGGPNGLIDANESVLGMKTILDYLSIEQTGLFFNFDGGLIPW